MAESAIKSAPTQPQVESRDDEQPVDGELLVEEELLVEDVSIDGMCGVY
jgi:mycofactocin precursor